MTANRYRLGTLIVFAALSGACDDPAAPLPSGVLSVSVDNSAGAIIRVATITLERPAPAEITYGAPGTPVLTMTADSQSSVHRFILPRLRANMEYRLEAGIPGEGGVHATSFTTAPLPPELQRIKLEVTGQPSHPIALIEIAGAPSGEFTGLLIVEQGQIVGSIRVPGSLFGMTRRDNGDFVVLNSAAGLEVHRLDGTLVHRLPQASAATAYGRIHHDVTATPSNTLLFITNDTMTVDSEAVIGEALWEWDPEAGTVVKRWSAFDHLDFLTERGREGNRSTPGNWLHGNGIKYGPRGNVLMSLRNISQVISIAPDFASVEWKLGGANPTLTLPDENRFFGQHYVSEPAQNRLLVYDNGFDRPGCVIGSLAGCYSRAVEYQIDVGSSTATQVWEYRPAPVLYAALVGSAVRLPNGNTVVLFGMSGEYDLGTQPPQSTGPLTAVEVDQIGEVRWRLTSIRTAKDDPGPTRLYRLTTVPALLGETPGSFRGN